jgi:hypothetical protein
MSNDTGNAFLYLSISTVLLHGCALNQPSGQQIEQSQNHNEKTVSCEGDSNLDPSLAVLFSTVEDDELLGRSLGAPQAGKLCQGKVYKLKADASVTLYRAWNSTNPNSEKGMWWALNKPEGLVSTYRENYEICYQWSPLDKLTVCSLKAGSIVVVGNGQSAVCSEYLSYGTSAKQQVYLENSQEFVENCESYDAVFSWQ